MEGSFFMERWIATLAGFLGLLALTLACVGLYGMMAYAVAQRTNEIGVRIALGASTRNVLWMIMKETLAIMLIGLGIGLPLSLAVSRLMSGWMYVPIPHSFFQIESIARGEGPTSWLFGISPQDPVAILGASLLMIIVGLLAGFIPARRAARTDPMVALRYE